MSRLVGTPWRAILGASVALACAALPKAASGHGGIEASAFVQDPDRPGVVVDQSFRFTWLDASDVGTATASTTHSFFFTEIIPPPWPIFATPDLTGEAIAEGIPEADRTNALEWDTSTVAAGAYWIWSIAADPDLFIPAQSIVFSPFPVVVAHPGDPVHPFVVLNTPDNPAGFAEDDMFEVRYTAFDPDESAVLRLERAVDGSDSYELVSDELPADVDGRWMLDTSSWPPGDWVLRIRLEDERGLGFTTFARFTLLVARLDPPPDAGTSVDAGRGPDTGSSSVDAGVAAEVEPEASDCHCVATSSRAPNFTVLWTGLIFGLVAYARNKQRGGARMARRSVSTAAKGLNP